MTFAVSRYVPPVRHLPPGRPPFLNWVGFERGCFLYDRFLPCCLQHRFSCLSDTPNFSVSSKVWTSLNSIFLESGPPPCMHRQLMCRAACTPRHDCTALTYLCAIYVKRMSHGTMGHIGIKRRHGIIYHHTTWARSPLRGQYHGQ